MVSSAVINNIVTINDNGLPVTTSLAIADGVERPHKSIIQLIRQNLSDFEAFGLVTFEILPRLGGQHGGGDTEYATLNEHHATLLITFLRNIGLEHKLTQVERSDGSNKITSQVRVTPKGLAHLSHWLTSHAA